MVARFEITPVTLHDLRLDGIPRAAKEAFFTCASFTFLDCGTWYLAGGTALAIQVGHRASVDLDFFTERSSLGNLQLERQLSASGKWTATFQDEGTLYGELSGGKVSFIAYPFFKPSPFRLRYGKICLLKPEDIAVMKVIAISQRGKKRDFVDLYWHCLNRESLIDVVRRTLHQYRGQEHNTPHILKSLVYFDDAEGDPMPELFFDADWKAVKAYFRREVTIDARELLGIGL